MSTVKRSKEVTMASQFDSFFFVAGRLEQTNPHRSVDSFLVFFFSSDGSHAS